MSEQKTNTFEIILIISLVVGLSILLASFFSVFESNYRYIGKIIDIEGGSSSNILILTLDNGEKVPYTFGSSCVNKLRIGMRVYNKENSNYLWVKYEEDKYC